MDEVFSFIGLPQSDIDNLEARNTRAYESMGEGVRRRLDDFYAPYNEMLSALLQEVTGRPLDTENW